jgi:ABC-type transporter MlaC component
MTPKGTRFIPIIVILTALSLPLDRALAAADPSIFIESIAVDAAKIGQVEQAQPAGLLVEKAIDLDGLGRFALGDFRKKASAEQLSVFDKLFAEFIELTFMPIVAKFAGQKLSVSPAVPSGDRYLVHSNVSRTDGSTMSVDWFVNDSAGKFRIADVAVGGISMAQLQREEVQSVIRAENYNIDLFLARLSETNAKLRTGQ